MIYLLFERERESIRRGVRGGGGAEGEGETESQTNCWLSTEPDWGFIP